MSVNDQDIVMRDVEENAMIDVEEIVECTYEDIVMCDVVIAPRPRYIAIVTTPIIVVL